MIDENPEKKQPFRLNPAVSPLIQLRKRLKYNRAEFAKRLGVDYDTVWRWETGRRMPHLTWEQIQKLDEIFASAGIRFKDFPSYLGPPPDASPDALDEE
ncbi:MAG: helix-turn-helix transcriptional regulator [Nostoc sp. DedSLP03]|uniref:helix-turn-helix domain-containing protein n=1 Tax=Nostoc sp. DedSLP03 TaxID=3075400 RepID=UPI002AD43199|nr:helix-turn-helix transcriptional regulator [Nostoc sp. DedSLP03]MDZ7970499.1 helix-turn-helix transcriptional regulator [Nostoc sp. DedSLP03]